MCTARQDLLLHFPPLIKPIERRLLRRQPNVRVVLQHAARQMARDGFDDVIWLTRLEQTRDDRVAQVMESQTSQSGSVAQSVPGGIPLAARLCWLECVVLVRAP